MGTPYRECPNCGAHLDAGEPCDCTHKERTPLVLALHTADMMATEAEKAREQE